jgi:hypothetical protein
MDGGPLKSTVASGELASVDLQRPDDALFGDVVCRNQDDLDLFVKEVELMRKLRHT